MTTSLDTEKSLRQKIHAETAKMPWSELQRWFASGAAVYVSDELNLVDVAEHMSLDNKAAMEPWIASGHVGRVSDEQAIDWTTAEAELWAVVVKPWVLVQPVKQKQ